MWKAGRLALAIVAILPAFGQSQTEMKIRLLGSALAARDKGDYATAKAQLEKLTEIAPNDPEVSRLLAEMTGKLAEHKLAPPRSLATGPAADRTISTPASAPAAAPRVQPPPVVRPAPSPPGVMPVVTEEPVPGATRPQVRPEITAAEAAAQNLLRGGDTQLNRIAAYVEAQRALARLHARNGDYKAAMQTLEDALEELARPAAEVQAERAEYQRQRTQQYLEEQKNRAGLIHHR